MPSSDAQQDGTFSYLSPAGRVFQDHPLRLIKHMVNQFLTELAGEFQAMYSRERRPSIPPGNCCAPAAASPLHHPQRPTADGAVGLQSPVPPVCRSIHGQQSLGRFRLFQESRGLSRFGPGGGLLANQRNGGDSYTAVGQALHRGWHPDLRPDPS